MTLRCLLLVGLSYHPDRERARARSTWITTRRTFVAPLPLATYEFRTAALNFVYLPKVSDLNEVSTLGFWVTVWLR